MVHMIVTFYRLKASKYIIYFRLFVDCAIFVIYKHWCHAMMRYIKARNT